MLRAAMQEPASVNPQRVIKRVGCQQKGTLSLFQIILKYSQLLNTKYMVIFVISNVYSIGLQNKCNVI